MEVLKLIPKLLAFSITISDLKDLIKSLPFEDILSKIFSEIEGNKDRELWIKNINDKNYFSEEFEIFYHDQDFLDYLKNRKNVKKYHELTFDDIFKEYDEEMEKTQQLIDKDISEIIIKKKINKLFNSNQFIEILEEIQNKENNNNEDISKKEEFYNLINDKIMAKSLLGNYFYSHIRDDLIIKDLELNNNIKENIEQNKNYLIDFAERVLKSEIRKKFNVEIKNLEDIWKKNKVTL